MKAENQTKTLLLAIYIIVLLMGIESIHMIKSNSITC